jgi:hypothetical protein
MTYRFAAFSVLFAAVLIIGAPVAEAQDYSNIRIVRLSFVQGSVQYQRPGEPWQDAEMNLPIQQGFALQTADGYAEVEFENGLAMRLAANSSVEFTQLALVDGGHITRLSISRGTALITANLSRNDALSVAASNLNLQVPRSGRFRVDVTPTESWVTVFHGKVEVGSSSGSASVLGGGHTLREDARANTPEIARSPAPDAFDKWVSEREQALSYAQSGTSDYLQSKSYTAGFADLYAFGLWSNIPGYGPGWLPYGVGPNWMPFVSGQWLFMANTGWNWISSEPWGWVPYHFGAWVNAPGMGWAWVPRGPLAWQPATATWVQVNGQLGWVPHSAPPFSKLPRNQPSSASPAVVLASPRVGGAIRAAASMSLAQATTHQVTSVPAPVFSASATGSAPKNNALVQSAPLSQAPGSNGPASLRAPAFSATQSRLARLSSLPPSMQAPRGMPAPAIMRGGAPAAFGRARGGPSVGSASAGSAAVGTTGTATVSAHGSGASSAGHSSGASSSASHR